MDQVISASDLSHVVGEVYECALRPEHWDEVLPCLANMFGCVTASLTLNDLRSNRFLINKAAGWDPDLLRRKSENHVGEINARLTEWLATQDSLDEPFVTSRHLSQEYVLQSEYVRECLQPQAICDIMHVFLDYTPSHFAELGLGRHVSAGVIGPRQVELAKLLLPHLRRAVTIGNLIDLRGLERNRMAEALDGLRCGVVIVDRAGGILHANKAAEAMFQDGSPLASMRGRLSAQDPSATRRLHSAIEQAAGPDDSPCDPVLVGMRDGGLSYAHVLPLRQSSAPLSLAPSAEAAVFISVPPDEDGAELIASAFELTPAEKRVLLGVIANRTLEETAAVLGIAPSTAKTHLDHIYGKVGVSRRTELVRLAAQLRSPVG